MVYQSFLSFCKKYFLLFFLLAIYFGCTNYHNYNKQSRKNDRKLSKFSVCEKISLLEKICSDTTYSSFYVNCIIENIKKDLKIGGFEYGDYGTFGFGPKRGSIQKLDSMINYWGELGKCN